MTESWWALWPWHFTVAVIYGAIESVYKTESCWFRKEIALPQNVYVWKFSVNKWNANCNSAVCINCSLYMFLDALECVFEWRGKLLSNCDRFVFAFIHGSRFARLHAPIYSVLRVQVQLKQQQQHQRQQSHLCLLWSALFMQFISQKSVFVVFLHLNTKYGNLKYILQLKTHESGDVASTRFILSFIWF